MHKQIRILLFIMLEQKEGNDICTAGGRVLGVTALDTDLKSARIRHTKE